ncbi:hypothetical protein FJ955_28660 [Mesorhizobium sp. B2-2-2]|nr:hypothetical protein FJ955_28660 [Mesorhizobium sp. B2-2-2]
MVTSHRYRRGARHAKCAVAQCVTHSLARSFSSPARLVVIPVFWRTPKPSAGTPHRC